MIRKTEMQRTPFAPSIPKPPKGPKQRKCSCCRALFVPMMPMGRACSIKCAIEIAEKVRKIAENKAQRAERASNKAKLLEMEPAKYWRKKAKTAMHAYVRAIAEGGPCCSCDTILLKLGRMGGDYDAGHFRPVSTAKHLEFDPRNIWGQCKPCNGTLHRGNTREYERRLRIKKGDEFVDELLADNEQRHLKIPDYQAIEAEYKEKLRAFIKEKTS